MSYPKQKSETYELLGGINEKSSAYVTSPNEFRDLTNMNFIIPGALTKRPGTTLFVGATISGRITGLYEFERLSGASYLIATANTNAYTVTTSAFSAFKTGLQNGALFDFVTFVDRLFSCNGNEFFKYDGSNTTNYSLPPGTNGWSAAAATGGSLAGGTYIVAYGYLNDRGYYGPGSSTITVYVDGSTNKSITFTGLTAPSGYGVSAIALYRTSAGGVDLFGTTLAAAGATTVSDTNFDLGTRENNDYLWFTLAPRYMELYNNQLFMAGFSSALSTAYWSELGEPEGVDPTYFAEFRTNDGDRLTGMKAYNGQLVVSKAKSLHRVTGDNPANFFFSEITDQYGFLSNRAIVVFKDTLLGLDSKGIVRFNGANVEVVSTQKVEPTFRAMNITAAQENAVAVHFRQYNEVWFGIPCDGATLNNCTVVYDYEAGSWTKYKGFLPSTFTVAKRGLDQPTVFYGGYTGSIAYFHSSLAADLGQAITCAINLPFRAPMGQTTEEIYRRLYINTEPVSGGESQAITAELMKNYSETVLDTRTMYQAPFQSRIDFGISAKSFAANLYHVSATLPLTIYGYTIEGRYQRAT